MTPAERFENVTVQTLANIFFEGKVVSHTFWDASGKRQSLGVMLPGTYAFNTGDPEIMAITAGTVRARVAGEDEWGVYKAGESFRIPGNSSFDAEVVGEPAQYLCIFG